MVQKENVLTTTKEPHEKIVYSLRQAVSLNGQILNNTRCKDIKFTSEKEEYE